MSVQEGNQLELKPAGKLSFIRSKHDLAKTLKKFEKETDTAIDFLASVIQNEELETKLRMEAAKSLIDFRVKISDSINKDEMNRMIAEFRLNPPGGAKPTRMVDGQVIEGVEDQPKPVLDFEYVHEV